MEQAPIDLGNRLENRPKRTRAGLVEECLRIDAADLRRSVVFRDGASGRLIWTLGEVEIVTAKFGFARQSAGSAELELDYQRGEQRNRTAISLETTTPHFGGVRFWFRCPRCNRRARTLFATKRELEPACRSCHGLQYRSAQTRDARVDELRDDQEKMIAMLFDSSGPLSARLRRIRLVANAVKAIERDQAKRMRARRKETCSDGC